MLSISTPNKLHGSKLFISLCIDEAGNIHYRNPLTERFLATSTSNLFIQISGNESDSLKLICSSLSLREDEQATSVINLCLNNQYLIFEIRMADDSTITDPLFQLTSFINPRERTRNVIELENPKKELDYFFALNNDIMAIVGADGYFTKINKAASAILGYSNEQLVQNPIFHFVHPADQNIAADRLKKLNNGEAVKPKSYRYLTKNNEIKWLEWNSNFLEKEKIIIATARDITEKKRQQQILLMT